MTFLAVSSPVAYAILAAVCALVFLLYRLRPPLPHVVVPSMLLWRRVLAGHKRSAVDWRWLLSLLLALGIALSIALALTRPEFPGLLAPSKRIVIVLDNSPSMAARTRDGESRWLHAISRARSIANAAGAGSQLMVADTMGFAEVSGFLSREAAIAILSRLPVASFGTPRMPPLFLDGGAAEIHLFTDGVALTYFPENAIVHSMFEQADNVGITAFEARPLSQDPTRYQAFVQVFNASPQKKQVRLAVRGGEKFELFRELEIPADGTADETFDVTDFEHGILRAEVATQADSFDADNVAYSMVDRHQPRRVLLVTPGDPLLEDAIRSLPGVKLATSTPSAYRTSTAFDAYVFDRFAPTQPPPAGALLFRASATSWLATTQTVIRNPAITHWDERHPLTAGVSWSSLRLRRAIVTDPVAGAFGVVSAKGAVEGDLVSTSDGAARWIHVGFALGDSNFQLHPGFVVFLGNALRWLTSETGTLTRDLGTVEVPLTDAAISDLDGNPVVATRTVAGTAFQATRPGVYTATGAGRRLQVICNVLDPRYAQINRSRLASLEADRVLADSSSTGWPIESWVLLLVLGAALLVADWAAFSRRMTV